ncbi:MAG: hypothetical protein ACRD34_03615 [Bryobacteraceae bacterium]
MIHRLCLLSLIGCTVCLASDNPTEILRQVDAKVLAHLTKAVNYTCVETVNRQYFTPIGFDYRSDQPKPERASCKRNPGPLKLTARDRLKLDVAVAGGDEMYSWHAARHFSTTFIDRIVRQGPIGSGGFVGFLENIFDTRGVRFRFDGRETEGAAEVFSFEYAVPLSASDYEIESGKHKKTVPFHGSFSAYTSNYELAGMTVIADKIPKAVGICASRNRIDYQLVSVAGNELLLPKEWTLGLTTPGLSTTSRSEYTDCREFAGQATISYKNLNRGSSPADAQPPPPPQVLPSKLKLKIRLLTPIDWSHFAAGDPVQGELLRSITVGRHGERIPRGALLSGVITRLEQHFDPVIYYLLAIEFNSMHTGSRTFLLRARPKLSPARKGYLRGMIDQSELPRNLLSQAKHGLFVFPSKRLHLDKHFSAEWVTEPFSAAP